VKCPTLKKSSRFKTCSLESSFSFQRKKRKKEKQQGKKRVKVMEACLFFITGNGEEKSTD
jgi:hypothetical protein